MRKRIGSLLLGFMLLVNGFSWDVLAFSGGVPEEQEIDDNYVWINPLYEDVMDESLIPAVEEEINDSQEARAGSTSGSFLSVAQAAVSMRKQMINRVGTIELYVQSSNVAAASLPRKIYDEAVAVSKSTAGNEGDYIHYHVGGYGVNVKYSPYLPGKYILTYSVKYYTTKKQETQVTAKVNKVLTSLGVKNKSTYNKVKAIYDYICKNVKYDYATLNDSSLGKFTSYQALIKGSAVCQGYASLFYRMARDAGVPARVIPGKSRGVPHAWNIVKVGTYYYNLDSTWDAGMSTYTFFLKNDKEFQEHTRDSGYLTAAFKKAYPISPTSYKKSTTTTTTTASKQSIAKAKVTGIKTKTYTGKKLTQNAKLKLGNVTLKKGVDYTVSYKNNTNIGTATVTFKGKGSYTGTLKKTFKIVVKKGKVYKVGTYKYRITNAATNGKGTVRLEGTVKNSVKLKKLNTKVKIGGKKFKITSVKNTKAKK